MIERSDFPAVPLGCPSGFRIRIHLSAIPFASSGLSSSLGAISELFGLGERSRDGAAISFISPIQRIIVAHL